MVRRVASGEVLEVTDHGHAIARIVPLRYGSRYDQMVAEGRILPAQVDLLDYSPTPRQPGEPLASEVLAELRADER
jgi:antitoxin (DNA-binding transcriptional repressor) of toxin-antitoxin stability system